MSSATVGLKFPSHSKNPGSSSSSNTEIDRSFSREDNSSSLYNKKETTLEFENYLSPVLSDLGGDPVHQSLVLHRKEPNKCKSETSDLPLGSENAARYFKAQDCQMNQISNKALNSLSFSTVIGTEDEEYEDCFSDTSATNTTRMSTSDVPLGEPVIESTETSIGLLPTTELIDPVLIRTIQTKECRGITGFSILYEKMYIVSKDSSEVEVFDSINFELICRSKLKGLEAPGDLTSCSKFRCIYIMDAKHIGDSSEILKVGVNRKIIHRWYVGDYCGCMSVTRECNIIVAAYETHRICEYEPDGMLLREIYLPLCGIHHPLHVLKLTKGRLLISYGSVLDPDHGVCVIHADSDTTDQCIVKSFGGMKGHSSNELDIPIFLALDSVGDVLVADNENNRVLLLSSCLQFKTRLLSYGDGLRHPYRLHVDHTGNRLVVSDNDSYMDDDRILIYEIGRIVFDSEYLSSEFEDDFLFYATEVQKADP